MSETPAPEEGLPLDLDSKALAGLEAACGTRLRSWLDGLADQPAWAGDDHAEAAGWVREPPPEEPAAVDEVLDLLFDRIIPCSYNTAGPGYLAYIPGGGLPTAALADYVAGVVNRYAGVWAAAPGAVELETQVIRWLAELMGMPRGSLGLLNTGASQSTLVALAAARHDRIGYDATSATAYVSSEAHHVVGRAARIVGVPPHQVRVVPVDERFRMRDDTLREMVHKDRQAGFRPFFACGTAGTVNTGAIDDLNAIADVCEAEDLWYHVDGAYGAVFRMVPELAPLFSGMERADSLAIDPHKGLFLPYGTGALLVRDVSKLRAAFGGGASYLPPFQDGQDHVDFCEISPELSRDWRGLRVWLPFKLHGVRRFREALTEKRRLAVRACEALRSEEGVEIVAEPDLSLFAFRMRAFGESDEDRDQMNRELLARINSGRRIFLTGTTLDSGFAIRFCVLSFRTDPARIDEAIEVIHSALHERTLRR